jgi:hypothetical protein
MKKNLEAIDDPLQTFEAVVELAAQTQERLDDFDEEMEDKDLFEIASLLDKSARTTLLGREIGVAGVFMKFAPAPEPYSGVEHKLIDGLIEGRSNGFTVKRIEDMEPGFYDDAQGEAFEKLRKKAMGSYVVCHMLTHHHERGVTADSGTIVDREYQALAPIVASEISLYGEIDDTLLSLSAEDINLIFRSTDRASRKNIVKMMQAVDPNATALEALLKASPYAEKVINRSKVPVIRSMLRALTCLNSASLTDYRYRFKELPPVLIDNGVKQIAILESKSISEVFFEGVSAENKFYLDGKGQVVIPREERLGVYIDAVAPISPIQTQRFSIPANLISPDSFEVV